MMKTLRVQLLMSHLVLIALMCAVMAGAVANFLGLGHSIDRILVDNYKSVIAAQSMKEALERMDSAAAFDLAGQTAMARRQYREYWPRFAAAHEIEAHNITEAGERDLADEIGRRFAEYRAHQERLLMADPPMPVAQARAYYFGTLQPDFARLKHLSQDVLNLNQTAIVRASDRAKTEAHRAALVSVAVSAGAFLLAIVVALHMIGTSLHPLRTLARQAGEIGAGHLNQRIELPRSDEIGALAGAFNGMAESLLEARRRLEVRLHRAERMSAEALASMYDPVIVTDPNGAVVLLNRAAEGLFGPSDRAAGRQVGQVVEDDRIATALDHAIRHERVSADEGDAALVPVRRDERERSYRLRATPMQDDDGAVLGAVAVLEDVTHMRELDRLKTEFISVASHELRTPVTSLLLSVQLLLEGTAGGLSEDQAAVVNAQREDLERLDRMMRELLDMTRLEAGVTPPRFELTPPGGIVEAAIAAVRLQAEAKGVCLSSAAAEGLPDVRADRTQMTRVLTNLLSNALRHTPAGGRVSIGAEAGPKDVLFRVTDTGTGIPADFLPRVFDRFAQAPGATQGGAGLGLSIAKTIVASHGGDIQAESEEGRGSVFTVTLPFAWANTEGEQKGAEDGAHTDC